MNTSRRKGRSPRPHLRSSEDAGARPGIPGRGSECGQWRRSVAEVSGSCIQQLERVLTGPGTCLRL